MYQITDNVRAHMCVFLFPIRQIGNRVKSGWEYTIHTEKRVVYNTLCCSYYMNIRQMNWFLYENVVRRKEYFGPLINSYFVKKTDTPIK